MNRLVLVLFSMLIPLVTSCRNEPPLKQEKYPPGFLADTESWVMTSSITKRTYQISVALPAGYKKENQPYPVLYGADANTEFGTLVETARIMRLEKLIPDLVIVGMGYVTIRQGWEEASRAVDLTPTEDQGWVREMRESAKGSQEVGMPAFEGSGGGAGFFRFIREELIPSIENKYNVSHEDRAFYGHSFGGLFGLHALLNNEGTFRRFILGSPSLWWDSRVTFAHEEAYAAKHKVLPARVFLSVGLLEERDGDEQLAKLAQVKNLREFIEVLKHRGYEGLELQTRFFEDETHTSVIPATISKGLRFIYAKKEGGSVS